MIQLRWLILAAHLALVVSSAIAEGVPTVSGDDPRMRLVEYRPEEIIHLDGFVGYAIHLEFASGEVLVNVAAGDMGALEIGSEAQHLWLKPKFAPAHTNISVVTNRRVYQFDYVAHRYGPSSSERLVYSIRFHYPEVNVVKTAKNEPPAKLLAPPPRQQNLNYWYCGAPTFRPSRVYDDEVQTHIVFEPRSDVPALFVKDGDGESLVNFTVGGDEVVIHRIARQFVFRRGKLVGCLENRSFAGGGEALPNGAVDPAVRRAVAGEGS
jgi:type IV secretion system protein VirB9